MSAHLKRLLLLCVLTCTSSALCAQGWRSASELAAQGFRSEGGFSFLVDAREGWPRLKRPQLGAQPGDRQGYALQGMYEGNSAVVFVASFAEDPSPEPRMEQQRWDSHRISYALPGDKSAHVLVTRLSPAVLLESDGMELSLSTPAATVAVDAGTGRITTRPEPAAIQHLAFMRAGKPVVYATSALANLRGDELAMEEPWILVWFGNSTPLRGQLQSGLLGDSFYHRGLREQRCKLDMPILLRLERRPSALRHDPERGLVLTFAQRMGKLAIMPLFGGRTLLPGRARERDQFHEEVSFEGDTDGWAAAVPEPVLAQCRLWSRLLRDYPAQVDESFLVNADADRVQVRNRLQWVSFEDEWNSPAVNAAPIPPMLAMALGGKPPVVFTAAGKTVTPADWNLMDTPGLAMGIEGVDEYEYQISGLKRYLAQPPALATELPPEALVHQRKLERHVSEMVEAGHLAPLWYTHGSLGDARATACHWMGSPELAQAITEAAPFLSAELRARALEYLKAEWKQFPPFQFAANQWTAGASRAPQPAQQSAVAIPREIQYRTQNYFLDLYRSAMYYDLTGETPGPEARSLASREMTRLLSRQDWATLGPLRLVEKRDRGMFRFWSYQGSATYNSWLGGAIGAARLAQRQGWKEEEELAWYLFAKLGMARIGQARYVAEMHRRGLVRGPAEMNRTCLLHLDERCAIVNPHTPFWTVEAEQVIPPFMDLTREVGMLLGDFARPECRIYADNLDRFMPLWYITEAPKQSGNEQRICPPHHYGGPVLAQTWILGKRGKDFARYVDVSPFRGDLYYIRNLSALLDSYR